MSLGGCGNITSGSDAAALYCHENAATFCCYFFGHIIQRRRGSRSVCYVHPQISHRDIVSVKPLLQQLKSGLLISLKGAHFSAKNTRPSLSHYGLDKNINNQQHLLALNINLYSVRFNNK